MEFSDSRLYNSYYEYLDVVRWFVFRAFPNDEYLAEMKIEKPFSMMEKLILDEDSTESHKSMFVSWCRDYERTLYGVVEMWHGNVAWNGGCSGRGRPLEVGFLSREKWTY